MASVYVERLDHLGLLASTIRDLGLIGMIDARLVPDEQEEITPGEAVAGMILNGLGFANRPLSLTPQFFANKPLDLLLRGGVHAEMFNRLKLGRTLDEVSAYGGARLLSELAVAVCTQEGIDLRFNHLDTTSFALSGDYVPDSDEHAITITHGYSKDHRPDLKQAVLELMVSQDGGVPLVSKSWDGNASDTQIFQERAEALMRAFARSPTPRYLVADAKLYTEDTATTLAKLGFITRIPGTLKLVSQVITQKTGQERAEVVYGVTSLRPERATPGRVLELVRGHWAIENKSHWVRDVTFDEDRSQVRCGNIPQVMAALRNTTIGLLRLAGHTNIAAACRRLAAQPAQALGLIGIEYEN